jgi:2-succinyl-6-hydroxy-2,4-cyclohexadiene-1-carboxylate synthase
MTLTSESQTMAINGVELAWSERGPGVSSDAPLVLCHGYTGSSHDWSLVIDALAAQRHVFTLDHRGHGHSTKVGSLEGYSILQLSADLAAFLEGVADGPVDLLGHSMGGRVVIMMALARPELVRSLILMDTSAWSFQPEDAEIRAMVQAFIEDFDPSRGMPSTMNLGGPEEAMIEAAVPASWLKEKDTITAGMDPYAFKALGLELWSDADDGPGSLRSRLGEITCPTTVIAGEHDHPLVEQAPALAATVGTGSLCVIEGAYHSPQLTHREEWLAAIEAHLARTEARA